MEGVIPKIPGGWVHFSQLKWGWGGKKKLGPKSQQMPKDRRTLREERRTQLKRGGWGAGLKTCGKGGKITIKKKKTVKT